MSSSRRLAALGALLFPLLTVSAAAQQRDAARLSFGVHLQGSDPRGEFAKNTDAGFGIGGYALGGLDRHGILNVRADLSFLNYANSRRRIPLTGTGGLIQLDLNTSSNIMSFVAGPQLLGPTGFFTPYATALGGFSVFWTQSTVEGSSNNNEPFASTTNSSDAVWAYGGAAGAYVRLHNGRHPVRLDLGARFLRHDDVRYLNEARVRDAFLANQPPVPIRGRVDFVTYYLGVNIVSF
ncbi:MAG: hypothetical protein LCH84_16335 [Gemmatimonadetes bacterium]|nr:hypothetical protein [Gemmatimonadota bacterium]